MDQLFNKKQNTSPVWVDDEYNEHFFNAKEVEESIMLFEYVRFTFPGIGVYRKAFVTKKDLIRAFYLAFNYLDSIDF